MLHLASLIMRLSTLINFIHYRRFISLNVKTSYTFYLLLFLHLFPPFFELMLHIFIHNQLPCHTLLYQLAFLLPAHLQTTVWHDHCPFCHSFIRIPWSRKQKAMLRSGLFLGLTVTFHVDARQSFPIEHNDSSSVGSMHSILTCKLSSPGTSVPNYSQ